MMKTLFKPMMLCSLLLACGCGGDDNSTNDEKKPFLLLNTSTKEVFSPAGSFGVYVTSSVAWNVDSEEDWLHPSVTSATGNKSITIDYDQLPSGVTTRTGIVKFSGTGFNPVQLKVTQTQKTFTNPIFQMPDPWIVKHGDWYYTCKIGTNGINISKSKKLSVINGTSTVWNKPKDNTTTGEKPWNVSEYWAPELHRIDGIWYIYYAAGRPYAETNSYKYQRTGVLRATGDDPTTATWTDMGMIYTGNNYSAGIVPTADNTNYAIDMGVFKLNGKLYAVWSGTSVTPGDQRLYIATMSNPYTINSNRVEISMADQSWEYVNPSGNGSRVNEGPAFLFNPSGDKLFLFYSCNGSWTKEYRLAYLMLDTTKDPMIPINWVKSSSHVFFRCDDKANVDSVNGLGHNCFTKSPDGTEDWIVYHVNSRSDSGWSSRHTFIQKFGWNADGTPNMGTPVAWGEKLAVPSGEVE